MIRRLLLRWLVPDAAAARALLIERGGWTQPVHNITVGPRAVSLDALKAHLDLEAARDRQWNGTRAARP
jgi:hypothetical protein